MVKKSYLLSLLAATCFITSPALGSTGAKDSQEVAAFEAIKMFEAAAASPSVPGISVALAGREGIIWAKGFGYADLENNIKMKTRHKMRIGSVAKVFTAASLMRLYDQGKVNLDAPITTYVPSWPAKHPTMTLRQLTSHTAGMRHYKGDEFMLNTAYSSVTESLNLFKDDALRYAPGQGHSYSTHAWTLVSAAVEGADGARDFKQIMKEEVFIPLAMKDSSFDESETLIPNRQRPYHWDGDKLVNSPQTNQSWKWAGGGFIASTSDVSRFAVAHLDDGFLKKGTLVEMHTKAKMNDGEKVHYGIGWGIGFERYQKSLANNPEALRIMGEHPDIVRHSGGANGGITMMILCKTHGRAVTVVKNVDSENTANTFLLALKTIDLFKE